MRCLNHLLTIVFAVLFFAATTGYAEESYELDVSAQELSTALRDFAEQSGLQVVYFAAVAEGEVTEGVRGPHSAETALGELLAGTDLAYERVDERTYSIAPQSEAAEESEPGKFQPTPSLILTAQASARQTKSLAREAGRDVDNIIGTIGGSVTDRLSGMHLKGAIVAIEETGHTTKTDDLGRYRFSNVPHGTYTLRVSFLGFADDFAMARVSADQDYEHDFAMLAALDEIVVFGQRSARAQALNQERAAENSSTVVSSDLLGNFEGTTISESLRRSAGISFQRAPNTGDGVNIIVRGLEPDMNAVKLNGLHLPVGNGTGRSADLSNLLADSVAKITINKSLLPSHDSAGTGGLIEIETKSPLGRPGRYFSLAAEGGRKGKDFGNDLLLSGTVSGTFGAEENFGLSASVQYRDRDIKSLGYGGAGLSTGPYLPLERDGSTSISSISHIDPRTPFPFEPGVDNAYINSALSSFNESEPSNLTITLSGEWQIEGHTNLKLDILRSEDETDFVGRLVGVNALLSYVPLPVTALGGEPRQSLAWSGLTSINQNYDQVNDQNNLTSTFSFQGNTALASWNFDYTLGYAHGSRSIPGRIATTLALSGNTLPNDPGFYLPEATDPIESRIISIYGARADQGYPLPLLSDAGWNFVNDPANFSFLNALQLDVQGENDRYTADFSAKRDFDREHLKYIEVGVNYESAEFTNSIGRSLFTGRPQFVTVPCCSLVFPTIDSLGLAFEDGGLSDIGVGGARFGVVSFANLASFAENLPGFADDPSVPVNGIPLGQDPRALDELTKEENFAAYFQTRFDIGALEIIGGARLSRVEVQALNLTSPSFLDEFFQTDPVFEAEFTRLVDERAVATDVLPRILFNFRKTDNLIFRGGFFLSVARPRIGQLSSGQVIALSLPPTSGPDGNQPLLQVEEGNPGLEPAVTQNFDLGVEYYHNQIGVIKIGGFYKIIDNLLQTNIRVGSGSLEGVTLPDHPHFQNLPANLFVRVSRPVNSEHSARIWGVEASMERQFTFLPGFWNGFGIFANYTFTRSSRHQNLLWVGSPIFDGTGNLVGRESTNIDFPSESFEQQPKHSGTAAVTYNKHNIDATLAYTFQSRRLSMFDRNNLSLFEEQNDSLDLRIEYRFGEEAGRYRIFFEGADLLKGTSSRDRERSIGGIDNTPRYFVGADYFGGRSLRLGFAATF